MTLDEVVAFKAITERKLEEDEAELEGLAEIGLDNPRLSERIAERRQMVAIADMALQMHGENRYTVKYATDERVDEVGEYVLEEHADLFKALRRHEI